MNCSWTRCSGGLKHTNFWNFECDLLKNGTLRWKLWRQGPASLIWGTIYSHARTAGQRETWSTTELCLCPRLVWVYGLAAPSQVFKSQSYQATRHSTVFSFQPVTTLLKDFFLTCKQNFFGLISSDRRSRLTASAWTVMQNLQYFPDMLHLQQLVE